MGDYRPPKGYVLSFPSKEYVRKPTSKTWVVLVYHRYSGSSPSARKRAKKILARLLSSPRKPKWIRNISLDWDQCRCPNDTKLLGLIKSFVRAGQRVGIVVERVCRLAHDWQTAREYRDLFRTGCFRMVFGWREIGWEAFKREMGVHIPQYAEREWKARQWRLKNPVPKRQARYFKVVDGEYEFHPKFEHYVASVFEAAEYVRRKFEYRFKREFFGKVSRRLNRYNFKPPQAVEYTADLARKHLNNINWKNAYAAWKKQHTS